MHKLTLTILAALLSTTVGAKQTELDSLYQAIDQAIGQAQTYIDTKQADIARLQEAAGKAKDDASRYELSYMLYESYRSFRNASAIAYLNRCIALADSMHRDNLKATCYTKMGLQLSVSGFYTESLGYLQNIPKGEMRGQTLTDYFYGMNHLYGELASYTKDEHMRGLYYKQSARYRDSLMNHADPASETYLSRLEAQLYSEHRYQEAMAVNDRRLSLCQPGTHEYAIVSFFRSLNYEGLGDREQQKLWLAKSALCDIKNAVMDQASLWSLADLLNKEGDLDRSYRYVEYSWACTSRFSTHVRSWLVSPVLTMINSGYKARLSEANRRLWWMVATVSLLALALLGSLVVVSRKRRQLGSARAELAEANAQLQAVNGELKGMNEELRQSNLKLHDSNRVKDEYITKFLELCSAYIDKLDGYRIKINRKLKANQYDDLRKLTSSEQMKDDELRELFDHFDAVFLHLFPTFVDDFNALLKPENRIKPTEDGRLTTDLRIFALIRLGIDESSRIADFLRYSPNSIYNYRARIKNKAVCERDEFERKVKRIGMAAD